ncbi:MAG: type III polyketide synthase [Actinomycetes bacterium]
MSVLAAVRPALPPHRYPQAEITEAFASMCTPDGSARTLLERVHAAAGVETRHLAIPLEEYPRLDGFGAANDRFIATGLDLAEAAVKDALRVAGLAPADVDLVLSVSVTGVATPSLDARLVGRLGLRQDVKRLPVFGLGCVAGAAGVARLHDHLAGHPDDVAVLVSVELCSLTVQRDDTSPANLVASGLFGDGAAAVVAVGDRRAAAMDLAGPRVVDTVSRLYPDTERVMGWDVGGTGFRVVLDRSVADVVHEHLGGDVSAFLARHGLRVGDVTGWVSHPGGPKVLDAVAGALDLPAGALDVTWASLAALGNLSSASVLHVLADTLDPDPTLPNPTGESGGPGERPAGPPPSGTPGVMLAMGPGFCAELVLLRW